MRRDQPFRPFLLRKALIDLRKHTHRSWYRPVARMHTGTFFPRYGDGAAGAFEAPLVRGQTDERKCVRICQRQPYGKTNISTRSGGFNARSDVGFLGAEEGFCERPVLTLAPAQSRVSQQANGRRRDHGSGF